MFKQDIINKIAEENSKSGNGGTLSKIAIENVVNSFQKVVINSLSKGEDVSLIGFLNFKVVPTKARNAKNPKTGVEIKIPAGKKVKVIIGKALKESVKSNNNNKDNNSSSSKKK
ncbi:MAG: HU family DNA-binding protein [Rickettsiales bacterium]|jgi:DNA-binding protein HU-beta|nr:HU family DNA-binding protein [Rickettsiales bacterium]